MSTSAPSPGRSNPIRTFAFVATLLAASAAGSGCTRDAASATQEDTDGSAFAWSAGERQTYFQQLRVAEKAADPVQRCQSTPDLPRSNWLPGAASASCAFLKKTQWTLEKFASILAQTEGAMQLDTAFAAIAREQISHPDGGDPLLQAFNGFDANARSRELARAWLAASPGSPHAMTALGMVELASGFKARGGRWARLTPPEQLRAMHQHLSEAQPLFEKALIAEPNYTPACVGLIRIARLQGDEALKQHATAHCEKIDGSSFAVMQARKTAAEPRWGGSVQETEEVNRAVKQRVALNPALAILLSDGDAETGMAFAKDKQWEQAYPHLQQASARAPNGEVLAYAGRTANKLGQHEAALIYLSQALRFVPEATWYRRWLARTYGDLGQWPLALAQLEQVKSLAADIALGSDYSQIAWLASKRGDYAIAKQAYTQALNDPKTRQDSATALCDIAVRYENNLQNALQCTQRVAADYPQDPMAQFMRAWVLTENRQPGAERAAQIFFALPDGLDKRQPQMSKELRALRQRMPPAN